MKVGFFSVLYVIVVIAGSVSGESLPSKSTENEGNHGGFASANNFYFQKLQALLDHVNSHEHVIGAKAKVNDAYNSMMSSVTDIYNHEKTQKALDKLVRWGANTHRSVEKAHKEFKQAATEAGENIWKNSAEFTSQTSSKAQEAASAFQTKMEEVKNHETTQQIVKNTAEFSVNVQKQVSEMAEHVQNKATEIINHEKTQEFLENSRNSKQFASDAKDSVMEIASNENVQKVAAGVAVGVAVGVAAPVLVAGGLGAAGFTAGGVAAGSLAAAVQTSTVAAGSLFAAAQATAAVGLSATAATAAGAVAGATTIAAATLVNTPIEEKTEMTDTETVVSETIVVPE